MIGSNACFRCRYIVKSRTPDLLRQPDQPTLGMGQGNGRRRSSRVVGRYKAGFGNPGCGEEEKEGKPRINPSAVRMGRPEAKKKGVQLSCGDEVLEGANKDHRRT